ncbi:MAG TPA: hypothetical protein VIL57_09340, partial [Bacteroidia bacterium]
MNLKEKLKKHYLFAVYLVVASGILIGLIEGFNIKYSYWVIVYYLLPLIVFYSLIQFWFAKRNYGEKLQLKLKNVDLTNKFSTQQILIAFVAIIVLTLIVHIII